MGKNTSVIDHVIKVHDSNLSAQYRADLSGLELTETVDNGDLFKGLSWHEKISFNLKGTLM